MKPENFADCTFLFDYDLSQLDTGLTLLEKLPKTATRCLVTGNFDNVKVRKTCEKLGIFLIPKSVISELPVVVV